jgi:hypothetical protein
MRTRDKRKATGPLQAVSRVAWISLAELMRTSSSAFFMVLGSRWKFWGETTIGLHHSPDSIKKGPQRQRTII